MRELYEAARIARHFGPRTALRAARFLARATAIVLVVAGSGALAIAIAGGA